MTSCTITGHRPTRFQFGYQENSAGCKLLKKRLKEQFEGLYQQGVRRYYVGGALGVDQWAGEILLHLKELPAYSDIELVIAMPFTGYDNGWNEQSRFRLNTLLHHSTEVVTVSTIPGREAYKLRNYYMVDHADILVAVYDSDQAIRSGTRMTVNYARKRGLPIILIHPDTAIVSSL